MVFVITSFLKINYQISIFENIYNFELILLNSNSTHLFFPKNK